MRTAQIGPDLRLNSLIIILQLKLCKIALYNLILKEITLRLLKVFTLGLLKVHTVRPHKVFPLRLLKVFFFFL